MVKEKAVEEAWDEVISDLDRKGKGKWKNLLIAIIISTILVCLFVVFFALPTYHAMTSEEGAAGMQGVMGGSDLDDPFILSFVFAMTGISVVSFLFLTVIFYFVTGSLMKRMKKIVSLSK